ncbi:MAG: ATP-binding protein [Pseudomonadota bacterium]
MPTPSGFWGQFDLGAWVMASMALQAIEDDRDTVEIGEIISVTGSRAQVLIRSQAHTFQGNAAEAPFIGSLLTIDTGSTVVICLITSMANGNASGNGLQDRIIDVELSGELKREVDGYLTTFKRGVSIYPRLGDKVFTADHFILQKVYEFNNKQCLHVGSLHVDPSIPALVRLDEMLGKHMAIVGSTGTGKSSGVALVLREILTGYPNAHIVLLDPHNEYGSCFGDWTERVRTCDLILPYWLLTFEEAAEILIGDQERYAEEIEILRELIPQAKRIYANPNVKNSSLKETSLGLERYSVDMPIPYRISDILQLLDGEMGRLEKSRDISKFKRLKARINTITQDPRYAFMFGSSAMQDNLSGIIQRLFRIPVAGKPITVIEMMGLPSEVVNVVVSVLARLTFDVAMWSEGKVPVIFVCEEAHKYVPRSSDQGFEPTKRAISRIAKEGRKYGSSLCVVSQRPGDIDPTIMSQCSTIFSMRLSNESDQKIIGSALSDASLSLLDFLPSLGTRECVVFGEGVSLPTRILFKELPKSALPNGQTARFATAWAEDIGDLNVLDRIVSKWRFADRAGSSAGFSNGAYQDNSREPELPTSQRAAPARLEISQRLHESFGDLIRP